MVNVAIQVLLLLSALLVNFVIPALYGLESYGAFIKANILVFLFQKLTDITAEPLIGHIESNAIFPLAVVLSVFIWILFSFLNEVNNIGSPGLLAAMLLSSCVMLSMHAMKLSRLLILYLITFVSVFLGLLMLKVREGWTFSIEDILLWTNLAPALAAAVILLSSGVKVPSGRETMSLLSTIVKMLPRNFALTLVFNLFTNLLPYVFSKTLPLADLGLFRVITALVQSATSIFPVNTKAIFVGLVSSKNKSGHLRALLAWSLLYFAGVGLTALVAASIVRSAIPYLALVASLPTLYWTVMVERYLQAVRRRRQLMMVNLAFGVPALACAFQVTTIEEAVLYYALGLALYAVLVLSLVKDIAPPYLLMPVALLAPAVIWLQYASLLYPAMYFASLMIFAWIVFKPELTDLKRLRAQP